MKSLYITRHTNGALCICAETTKKDGSSCVLYLSWNILHVNLLAPNPEAVYALKVGERIDLV